MREGVGPEQAGVEFFFGFLGCAHFAVGGAEREFVRVGGGVGFAGLVGFHEGGEFFDSGAAQVRVVRVVGFFEGFELLFQFGLSGFVVRNGSAMAGQYFPCKSMQWMSE